MDNSEETYTPFGDEWKAEMKKISKDLLIEMLRKALLKVKFIKNVVKQIDDIDKNFYENQSVS